jgi:hypothetical protein
MMPSFTGLPVCSKGRTVPNSLVGGAPQGLYRHVLDQDFPGLGGKDYQGIVDDHRS